MNHDSPREIRQVLRSLGVSLKKRWGQNFLVNRSARKKIVDLLDLSADESVWEIGPGLGSMTDLVVPAAGSLTLFEIDWKIVRYLQARYASARVVPGDVLDTWRQEWKRCGAPDKVLGNLPYNTASALIADFAETGFRPTRIVVTVQKELAGRMSSDPGDEGYSAFTVLCRYRYRVKPRGDLRPGSFYPRPTVVSTIVELTPRNGDAGGWEEPPEDESMLFSLVRRAFRSRRKTLRNNLVSSGAGGFREELFMRAAERAGVDPASRGETLGVARFIRLANELHRLGGGAGGGR